MGFARALAKLGLVELSEKEKAELPDDDALMSAAEIAELARGGKAAPTPARGAAASSERTLDEELVIDDDGSDDVSVLVDDSRSFEDVYELAQVQPSPFAADKLFKLLDGLSSLPADVRKQAVLAMDAAEDDWTIADSLVDARRKINALEAEKVRVARSVEQLVAQSNADVAEKEEYGRQASAEIRQQIADLEMLLQTELTQNAGQCEAIKRAAHDAQQAKDRADKRYNAEIARLSELSTLFGADPKE